MTTLTLREKIEKLPFTPGIYLMKDAEGEILYIGKALSLRKRVRSYLVNRLELPKISILMKKVCAVDYIETSTEVDALLLEAQLIQKYQPRYNKELKDDKSYPLLKITNERFPRIHLTRNKNDKKAAYYGPYTDAKLLREAVTLINALFPIRKCQRLPKTACLYYHIGQCLAPCIKPEVKTEYDQVVKEVRDFLGGGKKSFVEYLSERMEEAAGELRFEDAQYFKEQIEALSKLRKKRFSLKKPEAAIALSATLELRKSLGMEKLPEKIVCFDVSNIQGDEAVASKVSFYRELPDKLEYRRYKIKTVTGINDYAMIQEALNRMLAGIKEGRETFIPDIIMIDGGIGHWNAAYEVMKCEGFENTKLISIAKRFETIYGIRPRHSALKDCPDFSLIIKRKSWAEARRAEESREILRSAQDDELKGPVDLKLPSNSSALYLLQKIRDEAHRFAIAYHRLLKEKNLTRSELDVIPGIGKARKKILLEQFDSMEELKRAGIEQLAGLPGMSKPAARQIWDYFHPN
ncbi:MAG: excinuclease ABC subunit UvrC [Candidatus Omnitrophica bacterium]|nr:excinuclease ABC subunit UvrC [Candidatus Omnitrophota bacterium]